MTLSGEIKIGWKQLKTILENIRTAINRNEPVRGAGIKIDYTETGTIISLETGADGNDNAPPITAGQWTPVTIVDPTTCAQSTLYVWALPTS
jgi:hypothetical protein